MKTMSLPRQVVAFVRAKGPVTIDQVVADLGHFVTAARAMRAYHNMRRLHARRRRTAERWSKHDPVTVGTRRVLVRLLVRLASDGKIRRIGVGVYTKTTAG